MGFNTTIFILNDRLSDIEKDPERFVADIAEAVLDGTDHAFGQTTVIRSDHADVPRLYYTHRNSIIELSGYSHRTEEIYGRGDFAKDVINSAIESAKAQIADLERIKETWT